MPYLSLCYHYVRPEKHLDPYPDLFGPAESEFRAEVEMVRNRFTMISPEDAVNLSAGDFNTPTGKYGMLLSFDDGLSDHYRAAKILHEYGIKALFFISTGIFQDDLPANPVIIHYALEIHRIGGFVDAYHKALTALRLDDPKFHITWSGKKDDVWNTIKAIKTTLKYNFSYQDSRKILLHVWDNLLLKNDPELLRKIHLTKGQAQEMVEMGHTLGTHTRSHISVGATELSEKDFAEEMVLPKKYLEETFNTRVDTFSYPFGEKQDCLSTAELMKKTSDYRLAFTIEPGVNTKETSPFELKRYMAFGLETVESLTKQLDTIITSHEQQ